MKKILKKFYKVITTNLWVKLFCLFASAFLWVYVVAGQNSVGKFPGDINVRAVNVPSELVAVYSEKKVQIKVMADSSTWRKLSADTFSAYVDMSSYSAGTFEVPVNVSSSISGVQIVEKSPSTIFVTLEPIIQKEVSIEKIVEGSAADGFVVGDVTFDPAKVTVTGPKSVVENLTNAVAGIKLLGESSDFTKNVSLSAFDGLGEQINNVSFLPPSVMANVAIIRGTNSKTVGVRVAVVGQPREGSYIASIVVTPPTVDITGPPTTLSNIFSLSTNQVDVTGISTNIDKDVSLVVPEGISLSMSSMSTVHVRINVSTDDITRELAVTVSPKNLSSHSITNFSPSQIKVVVSGSADAIKNLRTSDILLPIDFSGKILESVVNFNISVDNIIVPGGVSVLSVSSDTLVATLSKIANLDNN